jgi:hypothetical protein
VEAKKIQLPSIRALYDQDANPPVTHILLRGDPGKPGAAVEPGIPAVLEDANQPFRIPAAVQGAKTSGRRKAFAEWITRREHRTIVTSSTYRQASTARPEGVAKDPENQWLWRMPPRRLEAEAVRDAVLAVAGTLDGNMYGEPVSTETKKSGEVSPVAEGKGGRRSIYQIVRRSAPQNFLNAFDAPVMEINCVRRVRSTSATQALALMNGDFVTAQAEHFAKRVLEKAPVEADRGYKATVRYAFRLAFGREPAADELDTSASFLHRQEKHYSNLNASEQQLRAVSDMCQSLISANEFIYLD